MKLAVTHTVFYIHIYLSSVLLFPFFFFKVRLWSRVGTAVWDFFFFFIFCFSPVRQRLVQSFLKDILIPLPLSVLLSSLLPFLCDSLILCPSYGLRVSPHFIDSVGALPYPSPELHSAWPIPIRQRPCHEQKSHCDQACIQLPMSLLALAAPAAWLFEQGWDFSLRSAEEESDECRWYSTRVEGVDDRGCEGAGIPGHWPWLRGSSDRVQEDCKTASNDGTHDILFHD